MSDDHQTPREIEIFSSFKRCAKKHYLHLISGEWAEVINCLIHRTPPTAQI
ncbi:hypothetical protein IM753_03685 [Moraxella sp. K127]|uniref:hypothetical protein n=1 Tax=Moraxella TaxID=475 RepID=UPI00188025DE|nr:hypothetical protein [Moraxella sp. K127]MBE9590087.1 hypothetical protein [Moraxella sp. K127]